MADPIDIFAEQYGGMDEREKDEFAQWFSDWAISNKGLSGAIPLLTRAGDLVGRDLTSALFQSPNVSPLPPEEIEGRITEAEKSSPWYRRGIQGLGAAYNVWENVFKTGGSIGLLAAAKLVPGQQEIEQRLELELRSNLSLNSQSSYWEKLKAHKDALRDAYDKTDTPWGVKGALELIFDPLNLIGWGIGAKLLARAPKLLRPLIWPLFAIDEAPAKIIGTFFNVAKAPITGISIGERKIPGVLSSALKPHWTTEIKHLQSEIRSRFTSEFGADAITHGTSRMTKEFLSSWNQYPHDTDPYSIRSVMDWVSERIMGVGPGETPKPAGIAAWEEKIKIWGEMEPGKFADMLSEFVAGLERATVMRGGKKFAGEVLEGTMRQRRAARIQTLAQRLRLQEEQAAKIGQSLDNIIYKVIDRGYLKKFEPLIIRPWATAHLAFAGFFPMNILEDIVSATVGMSGIGLRGWTDAEFKSSFSHLIGGATPPLHMWGAENATKSTWDLAMGVFKQDKKTPIDKIAYLMGGVFVEASGKGGMALRKNAWVKDYWEELPKVLRELGVPNSELKALKEVVQSELPESLGHLREEVAQRVWAVIQSGDPRAVETLRNTITATSMMKKFQMDAVRELNHIPTQALHILRKAIQEEGINRDNLPRILNEIREGLMDWHKFTPEGLKAGVGNLVRVLASKPPDSQANAMNSLRMIQHAWDTVSELPREINAHYRILADATGSPSEKQKLWETARKIVDEDLGEIRESLNKAMKGSRAGIKAHISKDETISRTVDEIFDGYKGISDNLQSTWEEYRRFLTDRFDSVPPAERDSAFWQEIRQYGDEIWSRERRTRGDLADKARTGWNHLFVNTPKSLARRDKELYKYGLNSTLGNVEARLEDIAHDIRVFESTFNELPEIAKVSRLKEIEELKLTILKLNKERSDLMRKLESFGKPSRPAIPERIREYDDAIRHLRGEVDLARKGDSPVLAKVEEQLQATIAERENILADYVPSYMRKEYDALIARRTAAEAAVGRVETEAPRPPGSGLSPKKRALREQWFNSEKGTRYQELKELGTFRRPREEAELEALGEELRNLGLTPAEIQKGKLLDKLEAKAEKLGDQVDNIDQAILDSEAADTTALEAKKAKLEEALTAINSEIRKLEPPAEVVPAVEADRILAQRELNRARAALGRFQRRVERNEAVSEADNLTGITSVLRAKLSHKFDTLPGTTDDLTASLQRLADIGDEDAVEFLARTTDDTAREAIEQLYTSIAETVSRPPLEARVMATLQKAQIQGDMYPDATLVKLVQDGYLDNPTRLRSGQWRVEITEKGREVLEAAPLPEADVNAILSEIPDVPFRTVIDTLMADVDNGMNRLIQIADDPPMSLVQEREVGGYINKVAKYLDGRTELKSRLNEAGQITGKRVNDRYSKFFVNYDNRSSLDFVMQRLMPFWMYESRRWPRLMAMAAKRPALARQFTATVTDWDYGYVPTPWGFEFNPFKGTIVGGLRRTLMRDFPELHPGWRGNIENVLDDWMGRGGFYLAPPFTAAMNIAMGEPAAITPPPISGIIHGLAATGLDLPWPLSQFAFDSRYSNFIIDQVIADKYGKDPKEIRRLAETGTDEGIEMFDLARREAALRMIVMNQASVLRFRPESKRQYIKDSRDAIEQYLGISKDDQDDLRKLAIPIDTVIPVSRFQRKLMKEAVPNYEAWSGSSLSLRPKIEQDALRKVDAFWSEMEREQEKYEKSIDDLNRRFYAGFTVGPAVREEITQLQRARSAVFERLQQLPEFDGVPLTTEQQAEWRKRFGSPPPIVHPLDMLLERYYSVSPDMFTDPVSSETRWHEFFEVRDKVLRDEGGTTEALARQALRVSRTPMEQELEAATPLIRQYYAIRDIVMEQLEQTNPNLYAGYRAYKQIQGLIQITTDPAGVKELEKQAKNLLAHNPELALIEGKVGREREKMRKENPEMEYVYQRWLSRPTGLPTPISPRRLPRLPTLGGQSFGG